MNVRRAQERHGHDGFVNPPGTASGLFLRDDNTWAAPAGGSGGGIGTLARSWYYAVGSSGHDWFTNFVLGTSTAYNYNPIVTGGTACDKILGRTAYSGSEAGWRTNANYHGEPSGFAMQWVVGFPTVVTTGSPGRRAAVGCGADRFDFTTDPTSTLNTGWMGLVNDANSARFHFVSKSSSGTPSTSDTGIDVVAGAAYVVLVEVAAGSGEADWTLTRLDAAESAAWTATDIPGGMLCAQATVYGSGATNHITMGTFAYASDWEGAL